MHDENKAEQHPDNELYNSIHKFADGLYHWILNNDLLDTEYEFGFWDHNFLSILISYWVDGVSRTYDNLQPQHWTTANYGLDPKENKKIIAGLKRQKKAYDQISSEFKDLASGKDGNDNKLFKRAMGRLKRWYLYMWD